MCRSAGEEEEEEEEGGGLLYDASVTDDFLLLADPQFSRPAATGMSPKNPEISQRLLHFVSPDPEVEFQFYAWKKKDCHVLFRDTK